MCLVRRSAAQPPPRPPPAQFSLDFIVTLDSQTRGSQGPMGALEWVVVVVVVVVVGVAGRGFIHWSWRGKGCV